MTSIFSEEEWCIELFRIVGNDSTCRRYIISWKCWQMNLNVEALLLPVTRLSTEIYRRLPVANRSSLGLRKQPRSHCTLISTKIKLYKTFIRPVVLCGCETLAINKSDGNKNRVFKRCFMECVWPNKGKWRFRYILELYQIYKEPEIVQEIKATRFV
jgi:hypothetical protein